MSGGLKYAVERDLQEALAKATQLREEIRRERQESLALRTVLRTELTKSRTLTWQARDCRATFTYSRLLARVRGYAETIPPREEKRDPARLLEENRQLCQRLHGLEARLLDLIEDRNAFFDAFQRYLEIERSFAALKPRS